MKIIDPHVDVADFYTLNKWRPEEFYRENSPAWATLPKLKATGIDVIGLTLYFDESFVKTNFYDGVKDFYHFYQELLSAGDEMYQIKEAVDFTHKPKGDIGFFYSIEGFECLRTPEDFNEFYDLGVRSFGFTWSYENQYACGRHSKHDFGLTTQGRRVIDLMNTQAKLIVDIAHLSEKSVRDVEKKWPSMIVTTHGNARSIFDTTHNLSDDEISIIVERNGVVSLFPLSEDTGSKGTFDELYEHLDYIASKWGLEYVGFSSDIYPLPEYPFIHNAQDILVGKKWSDYLLTKMSRNEVEQVMWGNWARVLASAL